MINWSKLQGVYDAASKAGVGFTLVYEEAAGTWYFTVNSASPSESFVGKSYSFDVAVESVLSWLRAL